VVSFALNKTFFTILVHYGSKSEIVVEIDFTPNEMFFATLIYFFEFATLIFYRSKSRIKEN
jgi:hypothetical protein